MNIRSLKDVNDMISKLNRVWTIKDKQGSIQGTDSGVVFDFSPKANAIWFPPLRKMTEQDGSLWWNVPAARAIVRRINALSIITFRSYRGAAFVADANVIFEAGQTGSSTPTPLPLPNRQTLRSTSKADKVFQYASRILQPGNGVQITETKDNAVFSFDSAYIISGGIADWVILVKIEYFDPYIMTGKSTFAGEEVILPDAATYISLSTISPPDDPFTFFMTTQILAGSANVAGEWTGETISDIYANWTNSGPRLATLTVTDNKGYIYSTIVSPEEASLGPIIYKKVATLTIKDDLTITVS